MTRDTCMRKNKSLENRVQHRKLVAPASNQKAADCREPKKKKNFLSHIYARHATRRRVPRRIRAFEKLSLLHIYIYRSHTASFFESLPLERETKKCILGSSIFIFRCVYICAVKSTNLNPSISHQTRAGMCVCITLYEGLSVYT